MIFLCVLMVAQQRPPDYVQPFLDSLREGSRLAMERRWQQLERERLDMERQKRGIEQRRDGQLSGQDRVTQAKQAAEAINAAVGAMNERHPDWKAYLPEMDRLSKMLKPESSMLMADYLEVLYLAAKYGTQSQAENAVKTLKGKIE